MSDIEKDESEIYTGFIYKIINNVNDDVYIGSTEKTLDIRYSKHKGHYKHYKNGKFKYVSVFDMFDDVGVDNCSIELIEVYELDYIENIDIKLFRQELKKREQYHIDITDCINNRRAFRTDEELKDYNKKYNKDWYPKYYDKNRERILERLNHPFNCICGGHYTRVSKTKHERTQLHQAYIQSIQSNE